MGWEGVQELWKIVSLFLNLFLWFNYYIPTYLSKLNEEVWHLDFYSNVHSSYSHKPQSQRIITSWMDKQMEVYPYHQILQSSKNECYSGALFSSKKEWTTDTAIQTYYSSIMLSTRSYNTNHSIWTTYNVAAYTYLCNYIHTNCPHKISEKSKLETE